VLTAPSLQEVQVPHNLPKYIVLRSGGRGWQWQFCLLCKAWADLGHLASKRHRTRSQWPEWYLDSTESESTTTPYTENVESIATPESVQAGDMGDLSIRLWSDAQNSVCASTPLLATALEKSPDLTLLPIADTIDTEAFSHEECALLQDLASFLAEAEKESETVLHPHNVTGRFHNTWSTWSSHIDPWTEGIDPWTAGRDQWGASQDPWANGKDPWMSAALKLPSTSTSSV